MVRVKQPMCHYGPQATTEHPATTSGLSPVLAARLFVLWRGQPGSAAA